jgi:hypothetical protein
MQLAYLPGCLVQGLRCTSVMTRHAGSKPHRNSDKLGPSAPHRGVCHLMGLYQPQPALPFAQRGAVRFRQAGTPQAAVHAAQ